MQLKLDYQSIVWMDVFYPCTAMEKNPVKNPALVMRDCRLSCPVAVFPLLVIPESKEDGSCAAGEDHKRDDR